MLVVVTLNGLATIERRLSEAPVPEPSAAPLLRPERTGLTESLSVAEDEASRPNAPPTSPRGSRHTRVPRYGYPRHGQVRRPPIKLACGVAPDTATLTGPTEPAEESR